ncbi:DUF3560 domain-containing protein [Streptomyces sp. NBC_01498]|uniref:DUF3560 domain-containing protein n=1 Tax=Streptomyces sp. NBC_01498 TaxID=2975870 RepID=UPI002E7C4547|nr:DUF3560 domain-containing protein [Streptomyces sp. NBC_01498]WTL23993.1 DUF3560 domain-containing protein [Streptomyces sp. NBC_01498]
MTDNPEDARRKADRLQAKADKLTAEAERRSESAYAMYGRFAGGQPLLRDHHSYRSARRTRDRADAASERAVDAYKDAERARTAAKWASNKAHAIEAIASVTNTRERPWEPSDFKPGDIVTVRVFETSTSTYRVKRVNKKTLTLDGGGGGWDDPKREYNRVLSRTRDGVTVTNPAEGDHSDS